MIIRPRKYTKGTNPKSMIHFNHLIPKTSITWIDHLPLATISKLSVVKLLRVTPKKPHIGSKESIQTQNT
jgi:hypothetical protein